MIYCILDILELEIVNYSEVYQDSASTVRKNNDESAFIISFNKNSIPPIAESPEKYTHSQMLSYLSDPSNGWIDE
jgi:hypothetical protein|tara:strand:+ start:2825 stop:3049 length:225 start_codon:yes stop_codon:yes gene_type:complete